MEGRSTHVSGLSILLLTALFFNFLFSLIADFKNANYLYEKPLYFPTCARK